MVHKIDNPETGKKITKHGVIYNKLLEKGIDLSKEKSVRKRKFKANETEDKEHLKNYKRNDTFKVDKSKNISWKEKKPHTKKERDELMEKCGPDAFLLPSRKKFPICNKITKEDKECSYNCRGLKAASSRAGEWGYKKVLKTSKRLTGELDCYKTGKKSSIKKENDKTTKKSAQVATKKSAQAPKKKSTKETENKKSGFFKFINFLFE